MSERERGRLPWAEVTATAVVAAFLAQALLDAAAYVVMAGAFVIAAATAAARASRATRFADGARIAVERRMSALLIGGALLVPLGALRTAGVMRALGIVAPATRERVDTLGAAAVVAAALLVGLPLLFGELALRAGPSSGALDARRIGRAQRAGLRVAASMIAGAFIATASASLHLRVDTARGAIAPPSGAVLEALAKLSGRVTFEVFFPRGDDLGAEVERYVAPLEGECVAVRRLDLRSDAARANEVGVEDDGVVVVSHDGAIERIPVGTDPRAAAPRLRQLDAEVLRALTKLRGPSRVVYLTTGHGEAGTAGAPAGRSLERLRDILRARNVEARPLDLGRGLGDEVPADAAAVFVLGAGAFAETELAALKRYAARGGRWLVALDPRAPSPTGGLGAALGLRVEDAPVRLERAMIRRFGDARDRSVLVVTGDGARGGRFASHPALGALTPQAGREQLYVPDTVALRDVDAPDLVMTPLVTSSAESFLDVDADGARGAEEPGGPFTIAAVVESRRAPDRGLRAFVLGSVDALCDDAMTSSRSNEALVLGALRWLDADEPSAAPVAPPERTDRIVHTRDGDAVWFWCAILGVPFSLAALGLALRRRLTRP